MARILLVDDDSDIREFGSAILSQAQHEVFAVDTALAALKFLERAPIDLLITDINMPVHSGFELVRFLRADKTHSSLPIAVLTGRRDRKDIERALTLGVHDYIIKPLDPELFMKKIDDLITRTAPTQTTQTDFATLRLDIEAKILAPVYITSISELGVTVQSLSPFSNETRIELQTNLFEKMGITPPAMRVSSSQQQENSGRWETRITFIGAEEKSLSKIRAWIYANSVKGRAA